MSRKIVRATVLLLALLTAILTGCSSHDVSGTSATKSFPDTPPVTQPPVTPTPTLSTPPATEPQAPPATTAKASTTAESPSPTYSEPDPAEDYQAVVNRNVCWLPGPNYLTYVKPSDHRYLWFFVRNISPATQIQTPAWPHWTQYQDGEYRIEGQYKDSNGQDMWTESDFFTAPFWTNQKPSKRRDQTEAYDQIKERWHYGIEAINLASQC